MHPQSSARPRRPGAGVLGAILLLVLVPAGTRADRRYFLNTYTPYTDQAGESEVELWLTSNHGKQDPAEGATLLPRAEWEYAITSRLSGAAYLNFLRPAGESLKFESTSAEFIYRLAELGRFAVDPAAYLEITESGEELELETKLLIARHFGRWVAATNVIGEFEFRHNDEELLASGAVLRNGVAGELTGGVAYGVGRRVAIGLEARGRTEHPNFGRQAAALFAAGPAVNLQLGRIQMALGALWQVSGTPRTRSDLNLVDFERTQVRVVAGVEL